MTKEEAEYHELRGLAPADRRVWLREHSPLGHTRPFWWLGLIEMAENECVPILYPSADTDFTSKLEFVASLAELAMEEKGMPHYYAVSRLARVAKMVLKSGRHIDGLPEALTPDGVAGRALRSFRLSVDEALRVAARLRSGMYDDVEADPEAVALGEIDTLLYDLKPLAEHIRDEKLAAAVDQWLSLTPRLSTVSTNGSQ
jgi:hypothetical protein